MSAYKFWLFQIAQLSIVVWSIHMVAVENTRRFNWVDAQLEHVKFYSERADDAIYGDIPLSGYHWDKDGKLQFNKEKVDHGIIHSLNDIKMFLPIIYMKDG